MKTVATLRAHLDIVRDISFHPSHPLAVSVSDDGMVKIWNLRRVKRAPDLKSAILNEPVRTCYSHRGPALCVAAGIDVCCSGGADGILRVWNMLSDKEFHLGPSTSSERSTYPHATAHIIKGHTDAVWAVDLLNDSAIDGLTKGFISASADGTTRVWKFDNDEDRGEEEEKEGGGEETPSEKEKNRKKKKKKHKELQNDQQKNSGAKEVYCFRHDSGSIPTSLIVPNELSTLPRHQAIIGYRNGCLHHVDCQQGKIISNFGNIDNDCDSIDNMVHKISLHPTMSLAMVAKHDGKAYFYDTRTLNKPVSVQTLHASPVTTIACEPMGLTYATGSSEGDIRLWDLRTVSCNYCLLLSV
jgi:striatin 1/3/4